MNNNNNEQDLNKLLFKILRVILTLIVFTTDKEEKDFKNVKSNISTSVTYTEAVRN